MLSTEGFKTWSSKVVLFLHNTSRCKDEPYPRLLREKGGNGFPTVSLMAADGRLLKQLSFPTTLPTMEAGLAELKVWQDLKSRAADGDAKVIKELFLLELSNSLFTVKEGRAQAKKIDFSNAEAENVEQGLVNLEFHSILRSTPRKDKAKGGAKLVAMFEAGRFPKSRQITSFWDYMFAHAVAQKDIPLYEKLLVSMKEHHAGDRRVERYLGMLESQLERLRKQK